MSRFVRYAPVVLFIFIAVLFFYKLAFTNLILARGDTFTYFYPYWDIRNDYFQALQLPLWTPHLFMGSPLLAEPQLGTFYPPNWLTTPFTAPDAIRYSILLHVFWAGLGMYSLFNYFLPQKNLNFGGIVAGVLFACGGYVGAHVEQINQLQGLSWMPWVFWLYAKMIQPQVFWQSVWWALWLTMAFAMQFFSGHTQTVFISGVGLGLFAILAPFVTVSPITLPAMMRRSVRHLLGLVSVALITLLLVMPQFIPTLELTGMSNRGGSGFNRAQATAFSLPPHYIGRSLLPSYDGVLFSEYIGTIGVIGLGLALLAIIYPRTDSVFSRWRWVFLLLTLVGLLFAFGRYNPLYYDVLAEIRGFNLFRVPARWLALFTLGIAMLAGMGVHFLLEHRQFRKRALVPVVVLGVLMFIARVLPSIELTLAILPEDFTGSSIPSDTTVLLWGGALLGFMAIAWVRLPKIAIVGMVILELWGASQVMPYNDLVPPEVYAGKRFTVSQMQAYADQTQPMGRLLSVSQLLFDVGDKATLRERYQALGMSEEAIQIAFTALKRQEILNANLPLTWNLESVDGYGGGILPTMNYSQFTSLILPSGAQRSIDGRLSEILAQPDCNGACVPNSAYLAMMNVSYFIRDRIDEITPSDLPSVPTDWQKVLSSDIKIFRLPASTRVTLAQTSMPFPDTWQGSEDALVQLQADPLMTVIHGEVDALTLQQTPAIPLITQYTPTQMTIQVKADAETYLVIADAWYPHWQATVNGQASPVYRANVMFRAVQVPAGESEVILTFIPTLWYGAIAFGAVMWVLIWGLVIVLWRKLRV